MKSAIYLEGKETSAGKKLSWNTLKQHLIYYILLANYSEISYDMHAINAYDTLQQGSDEPTEGHLHRAQDILEHIHHTNNMSKITAIGTKHAEILTSLKDKKLYSKLAESKVKKWSSLAQVLLMLLRWPSVLRDLEDISYHPLRSTKQLLTATNTLVTANITTLTNIT